MAIKERLKNLRQLMTQKKVDAIIIPTSDYHQSEYVGSHFKAREFMSGFTGSAGVLVVTATEAGLWTDGRYFIQAAHQLEGTTIELMKQGEEGVPSIEEFLENRLKSGQIVAFDGKVLSASEGIDLEQRLSKKGITIYYSEDLVDAIWIDRDSYSMEPAFLLEEQYSGKSAVAKIEELRNVMREEQTDVHILTTLDDVAWLLNIRGNDVPYNPVILSYVMVTLENVYFYVEAAKIDEKVKQYLAQIQVTLKPYDALYEDVTKIAKDQSVLYDLTKVNYAIYKSIPVEVKRVNKINPTILAKAIKNPVEQDNLKKAHIKDGVAVTKFMYWLKTNIGKIAMTEVTASDYLEECRKAGEGFTQLSFNTISAYNANAAMMHYSATEDSCAKLEPQGMLLVDSGGQYYEGTTDVTRTFILGPISDEMRKHFTTTVKSMLNLQNANFLYGCNGQNLDILARGPFWDMNLDYKCGTGHGVGYMLNVHEAPNGFRWKKVPERNDSCILEEGMVTTDEPGVYIEGSHGIRIENELLCKKGTHNEYGQYMHFEPVTMVPIDLDGIDTNYFTTVDKARLNAYHKLVFETISPYFEGEELAWLKKITREI
ncbi:Xaa-Pro aminopeptidase [Lachnospiraceae bacterium KM106-2]|nr:Xaa-Pro aminopeptidase [Lachnospiraceae bacterium KM106-2]